MEQSYLWVLQEWDKWTVRQGGKGCWQEITEELDLTPPSLSCVTLNKSLPLFGPLADHL